MNKITLVLGLILYSINCFALNTDIFETVSFDSNKACGVKSEIKVSEIKDEILKINIKTNGNTDNLKNLFSLACLLLLDSEKRGNTEAIKSFNDPAFYANISFINPNINLNFPILITDINEHSLYDELIRRIGFTTSDGDIGEPIIHEICQTAPCLDPAIGVNITDDNEAKSIKDTFLLKFKELYVEAKKHIITEIGDIATYVKDGGTLDLENLKVDPTLTTIDKKIDELLKIEPIKSEPLKKVAEHYKLATNLDDDRLVKKNEFIAALKGLFDDNQLKQAERLLAVLTKLNGSTKAASDINTYYKTLLEDPSLKKPTTPPANTATIKDLSSSYIKDGTPLDDTKLATIKNKTLQEVSTALLTEEPVLSSTNLKEVINSYVEGTIRDSNG